YKLAFIRNVQRIQPEQLACAAYRVADRYSVLKQEDAQATVASQFVQRSGNSTASGIAHPSNRWSGNIRNRFHERQHGARIRTDFALEIQFSAREQNGNAMIADRPANKHFVAGPNRCGRNRKPRDQPAYASTSDVHAISLAVL